VLVPRSKSSYRFINYLAAKIKHMLIKFMNAMKVGTIVVMLEGKTVF